MTTNPDATRPDTASGAGLREPNYWCPECSCRSFARCDERQADGTFRLGPIVRCVNCKRTYYAPLASHTDAAAGWRDITAKEARAEVGDTNHPNALLSAFNAIARRRMAAGAGTGAAEFPVDALAKALCKAVGGDVTSDEWMSYVSQADSIITAFDRAQASTAPAGGGEMGPRGLRWCQPGDERDRMFILRFSDPDMREQLFMGADAEERALRAWKLYAPNWNVYLLSGHPWVDPGRFAPTPDAPAKPGQGDEGALLTREWLIAIIRGSTFAADAAATILLHPALSAPPADAALRSGMRVRHESGDVGTVLRVEAAVALDDATGETAGAMNAHVLTAPVQEFAALTTAAPADGAPSETGEEG